MKTSIVITTNRSVAEWGEVLGDTTVAAAMLDRLLHRSVVIKLDGDSYRLRDQPRPHPKPAHRHHTNPTDATVGAAHGWGISVSTPGEVS